MEENGQSREELIEEIRELRSRVQHLEGLNRHRDIVEEKLRTSEERLRAFFENAAVAVAIVDPDGRVVDANEEKYRSIVEQTTEWIWEMDRNGVHTFSNPAGTRILGYSSEEMAGLPISSLLHPEDSPEVEAQLLHLTTEKRGWRGWIVRLRHKDGSYRVLESNADPIFDSTGQILGYRGADRDITDRKLAEMALKESEQDYREIFNGTQDAILIHDPETGAILDVNQGMLDMYGYSREEALRTTVADLSLGTAPFDQPNSLEMIRKALTEGPQTFEWVARRKNGKAFWTEVVLKGTTIRGAKRVLAVVRDSDGRKQMEAQIQERERRLNFLLSGTPAVIYTCIPSGNYPATFVSENAQKLLGYQPNLFVEDSAFWLNHIHPEDRERVLNGLQTLISKDIYGHEYRFRLPDGTYRWMYDELRCLRDIGGRPVEVLGFCIDITERKRAEEELHRREEYYRSLFENAMDMVILTGSDGTILFESTSVKRILGFNPEELVGLNVFSLIHPGDAETSRILLERLARNPGGRETAEIRFQHKDGGWRMLEAVGSNLLHVPAVGAIVANMRDVTERRKVEQRLRVSLQEKEILLREVHHRVKNNLQVISSLLDLQEGSVKNPDARGAFRDSQQRVKTMAMIHERLYAAGEFSRIALNSYIEDLVHAIVQANCPGGPIAVQFDLDPIPLSVNSAMPCGLIVNELISNCLKHAFPAKQKGNIRIEIRSTDENRLTLLVEDDGRGLPENADIGKGGSLGLSIVRALVKQLNGTMEIERGAGTRFRIEFSDKS